MRKFQEKTKEALLAWSMIRIRFLTVTDFITHWEAAELIWRAYLATFPDTVHTEDVIRFTTLDDR
jgi:hypothetical protein